jgi:hypothetical protein
MDGVLSTCFYFFVFITSAIVVQHGYRRKSKLIQLVGLLLPIMLGGLRYDVGLDYSSYLSAFADIANPQVVDYRYAATPELEHTFYVISHISNVFFASPIAMYSIYCAITVFAFYAALSLMKPKNVAVALFFFYSIFYLNSFNIMRQGAAISLGCLAQVHYIKGNKGKAFLYLLLATAFHISALLLVVFILIERIFAKRRMVKEKFVGIFITTCIVSIGIGAVGVLIPSVRDFVYEITGRIGELDATLSMGVVFKYMLSLMCLYLVVYAWKHFDKSQKQLSLLVASGAIIYALGLVHNEAARLGIYLIALTPILFAVAYDNLKLYTIKARLLINGGLIFLSTLYIAAVHVESGKGVQYDYQSVIMSEQYREQTKALGI